MNEYYTYAYLRENGTPYYIGKGKGNRLYNKNRIFNLPKDKSRIIFLKQNLTEQEAFIHEIYMIAIFGRKDLGTGILRNRTNGGEGPSGAIPSESHRRKISEANTGKPRSIQHRRKIGEANRTRIIKEETRKKIIEFNKIRTFSQDTKIKMSETHRGALNPMYGKSHSTETKRKISESLKGTNKGKNNPAYGKKWWNDGAGNTRLSLESPGDTWKVGRGTVPQVAQ